MEKIKFKKFYNYDIYEDGSIYSHYSNKFLKPDNVQGYLQCTLSINNNPKRYKCHRLVAMLFLDLPSNYVMLVVNHKDGNKLNNHYSNLEWCTYDYNNYHARINGLNNISKSNSERWENEEFRKNTSEHISKGIIKNGSSSGEKNGRFRYRIYDKNGKVFSRKELKDYLGLSQSYTDTLIREYANGNSNMYFDEKDIFVKDTKRKVNRLSKTTDNEKTVA